MKLSLLPLVLSAGLAISQVSAAPLRVVWVSEKVTTNGPVGFVRVGHAGPPNSHAATMHITASVQTTKSWTKPKVGCAGSLRTKASKAKEWLKHAFGIAPPYIESPKHGDASWVIPPMPLPSMKVTYVNPPPALILPHAPLQVHHAHHPRPQLIRPSSFGQRLTRALMMLGPWEGRILAFVIGCGIGVLIRMFWVLAVLLIRSARGPRREEEFLADEVIFEEQEHLLPPQYTESNAFPEEGKEKN